MTSAVFATSTGSPVPKSELETVQLVRTPATSPQRSYGPQLLQDIALFDNIRHFSRERIPERILHAKGAAAHGYFIPTKDLSDYTIAHPFQTANLNKKVPVTARFSTVSGESGSADTVRTFRGFAVKLKTEVGNWDWVFINFPVFSIRDPAKLIGIAHAQARDPKTHFFDPDRSWDNFSSNPEMIHQILYTFSDYGITDGYSYQHAFSVNPFSWVNKNGEIHYVKIQLKAPELKILTSEKAAILAGIDPDYNSRDLYTEIAAKNFPKWNVEIQVMSLTQAEEWTKKSGYNVFDATKSWPETEFKPIKVGELVLDSNPENYFAEVEQLAFAPSTLIPGVIPSPDPVLQTRLFIYPDTQSYRLGVNLQQLPANKPKSICPIANFQRDGFMAFDNQAGIENYKSTLKVQIFADVPEAHQEFIGRTASFLSDLTKRDFKQPAEFWASLKSDHQKRLIKNVGDSLRLVKTEAIKSLQLDIFATVNLQLGKDIGTEIGWPKIDDIKPLPNLPE